MRTEGSCNSVVSVSTVRLLNHGLGGQSCESTWFKDLKPGLKYRFVVSTGRETNWSLLPGVAS